MFLTEMGLYDNYAGMLGGLAECGSAGAQALSLTSTTALMGAAAAFSGSAGAFFNAAQNWQKASGKLQEGDNTFAVRYFTVSGLYIGAGAALTSYGTALIVEWLAKRAALKAGVDFVAGRVLALVLGKFNAVGWVITIVAFVAEGIVDWYDRSALEAWVEQCYFGNKAKWKALPNGQKLETLAWENALQKARDQAVTQEHLPQ